MRAARAVVAAVLAAQIVVVVYAIAARVSFPYASEWMTGSVLDHVERVLRGEPLYTEPSASWIAYIYPPLYPWIVAVLGGSALAGRVVSLVSVAIQMEACRRVARDLGAGRFWSWAAAAMVLACYRYVGFWYDLERSDTLAGTMVVVALSALLRARTVGASPFREHAVVVASGVLGGLAILAKQQAAFYVVGAALGLGLATGSLWRGVISGARLLVPAGLVAGALSLALDRASGGWFSYFVIAMPRAHGVTAALAEDVFPHDVGRGFLLYGATFFFAWRALARGLGARAQTSRERAADGEPGASELVFTCALVMGFFAAVSSRLHVGGWINVLAPWSSLACVGVAVVASRVESGAIELRRWGPARAARAVAVLLVAQTAVWAFDPREFTPRPWMLSATERFHARVGRLEERGEVLLVGRGHVTRARHFQMSGLADAYRMEGRSPPDLVAALRDRRFAAIIDDARLPGAYRKPYWPPVMLEDLDDLVAPLFASYFVAEQIPLDEATLPMIAPGMPRWVLLPRRVPLGEDDRAALAARHLAELRLVEERAVALAEGRDPGFAAEDVEDRAAAK